MAFQLVQKNLYFKNDALLHNEEDDANQEDSISEKQRFCCKKRSSDVSTASLFQNLTSRISCVSTHKSGQNAPFIFDAEPTLISRQLSNDGTARLAEWEDVVSKEPIPVLRRNGDGEWRTRPVISNSQTKRNHKTLKFEVCSGETLSTNAKPRQVPNNSTFKTLPQNHLHKPKRTLFYLEINQYHRNYLKSSRPCKAKEPISPILSSRSKDKISINSEVSLPNSAEASCDPSLCSPDILFLNSEYITLNIPVLGYLQSGKTSLLQSLVQAKPFSRDKSSSHHSPNNYYPIVMFNDQVYNLRLIDCPMLTHDFPHSTLDVWAEYRGWGLHLADLFILVFDITSELSFQYMKTLREQIIAANIDVPMVIVANKVDLVKRDFSQQRQVIESSSSVKTNTRFSARIFSKVKTSLVSDASTNSMSQPPANKLVLRRELAVFIKKNWKRCVVVECSAAYNYNVLAILKEALRFVQIRDAGQRPTAAQAVQAAWQSKQCTIL